MTTAVQRLAVASSDMADSKPRTIRMEQRLWDALGPAAMANGHDRSGVIKQFVRWYLSEPGAQLPVRPSPAPSRPETTTDTEEN